MSIFTEAYVRGLTERLQRDQKVAFPSTEHMVEFSRQVAETLPEITSDPRQRQQIASYVKTAAEATSQKLASMKIGRGDMTAIPYDLVGFHGDRGAAYGDLLQKVAAQGESGGGMVESLPSGVNSLTQAQGAMAAQEMANRPPGYASQEGLGDPLTDLPPGSTVGRETPHPGQDTNGGGSNVVTQNIAKSATPYLDQLLARMKAAAHGAGHGGGMVEDVHGAANTLSMAQGAMASMEKKNRPPGYAAQSHMGDNLSSLPAASIVGHEMPHPGRDINGGGSNVVTQNIAKTAAERREGVYLLHLHHVPLAPQYKVAAAQRAAQMSPQDAYLFVQQIKANFGEV